MALVACVLPCTEAKAEEGIADGPVMKDLRMDPKRVLVPWCFGALVASVCGGALVVPWRAYTVPRRESGGFMKALHHIPGVKAMNLLLLLLLLR